ncbi:hypothetical protein EQV97_12280 [Pseudomonas sp. TMW22090]|nr:hypothetical protein [Pseudomonas sp. TMW22090]
MKISPRCRATFRACTKAVHGASRGTDISCNVNAPLIRRSKYKKGGSGRPFLWPLPLHYRTQARHDLSEYRSREATKIVQE